MAVDTINDNMGVFRDTRAIILKILKRLGIYHVPEEKMEHFTTFDEYPSCEACGSEKNKEVLVSNDDCHIVACEVCGLWFTSPRIAETVWMDWLKNPDTDRNKILTENRIRYGRAMPRNIKLTRSGWFQRHKKGDAVVLGTLKEFAHQPIKRLHDVGCGVGFFLMSCREVGIDATGNDLNEYAIKVMKERFDLEIVHGLLDEVTMEPSSLDAVTMNAYIEHTYHPLADLRAAFNLLKKNGLIYVSTFHTDSAIYERIGNKWDMFEWNHVYHFSSQSLETMMKQAGFHILRNYMRHHLPVSYIIGKKE